MDNFMGSL